MKSGVLAGKDENILTNHVGVYICKCMQSLMQSLSEMVQTFSGGYDLGMQFRQSFKGEL